MRRISHTLGFAAVLALVPQFPAARAVALDVFVADQSAGTVRRYSGAGADLGVFASGLNAPSWITADPSGNIYVTGSGKRVLKFSPSGVLQLTITTLFTPGDVVVSRNGAIYVADHNGGGIHRYSATGANLGLSASTPGLLRGDFMAVDTKSNLYVSDFMTGVIRRISPLGVDLGNFVTGIGGVTGITFGADGNLYAAIYSGNIVKKYSPSGADLGTFATTGLSEPYGLAFDPDGNLYVANYRNGTIRRFSSTGADLGVFASGLAGPRDVVVTPMVTTAPTGNFRTKLSCPSTATPGATITATATFKNTTQVARTVTRSAVGFHAGGSGFLGPTVLPVDPPVTVPAASLWAACPGCAAVVTPAMADRDFAIRIPSSSVRGTFVSVVINFLGRVGSDSKRRSLDVSTCTVEIPRTR